MDIFLSILIGLGIVIVISLLLTVVFECLVGILYEGYFGKRFEIFDTELLPDVNDYPDLEYEYVDFMSDKRKIRYSGCYYHNRNVTDYKGLLVVSHGIFNGQICYLPEIAYFAKHGYKVFAFDNYGSHLSGGKSLRGLPQSAEDLDCALRFVSKENTLPLFLFGHSWGGYAVSAVSCYNNYNIKGVFVQSGFNRSSDMLLEQGMNLFGKWLRIFRGNIKFYERMKYGKEAGYTARQGINKAIKESNTKFLILHSLDDKVISIGSSVLASVDKHDNIKLISEKKKGHDSLDSDRCIKHKDILETKLIAEVGRKQQYNRRARREFFMKNADKAIYFERDARLMRTVCEFYDDCARQAQQEAKEQQK